MYECVGKKFSSLAEDMTIGTEGVFMNWAAFSVK